MDLRTGIGTVSGALSLLPLLLLLIAPVQAQQMYRWVDKDGRVTYSQNPPPAGAAKSVEQRRITGGGGGSGPDMSNLPYAAQVAVQNFPVTLYTSPDCTDPCKNGRDMLTKRGIPFKEVVTADEKSVEALKQLSGQTRIPVLLVGRQVMSGYEATGWKAALDDAGYPASIPTFARAPAQTVQRNLPQVKLYATSSCGPSCQNARDLLGSRQVPFQEVLVESPEAFDEMKAAVGSADVVPALLVGGSSVVGFNPDRYNSVLNSAGFSQSNKK